MEEFGGMEALLFMVSVGAPPVESLEVAAWERAVDVNVKGFLYSMAAALPALRERGGHVIALGAGKPGPPDPLRRANRAAVSVLIEELDAQLAKENISVRMVAELDPQRCAETVYSLLSRRGT